MVRGVFLAAGFFSAAFGLTLKNDGDAENLSVAPVALNRVGVETTSCAAMVDGDNFFMSEVVKNVGMGNYTTDTVETWHAFQDKLSEHLLSQYPDKLKKKPLKTLVVSAVHDTSAMVEIFEINMNRLKSNKHGDGFEFALFHIDGSTKEWRKHKWYRSRKGPVVHKHLGAGCKPQFWAMIPPKMARAYDYLWLLDEDIRLDFVNWDFYRTVLSTLDPVVSQPVIIPKEPNQRSTGVTRLRMVVPTGNSFPIAYETPRSEVQAPVISAKIWAAVHERNMGNDRRNDWYIDDFWDVVAFLGEAKCKKTGVLAVNGAPVRHMDCHNLFKGTKCVEGCGDKDANCRPVTPAEERLVQEALKEVSCDVSADWSKICEGKQIHDCHTELWSRSRRQQWNAPLSV